MNALSPKPETAAYQCFDVSIENARRPHPAEAA